MYKNRLNISAQFLKYTFVGSLNTLLDLGFLFIFVEYLHIEVITASVFSFVIAVANSFILNKLWTFKNKSTNYRKQFIKFLIVSIIGLGLNTALMFIFVNLLRIWYIFAKVLTSFLVLTWNFLANKFWTFKIWKQEISLPEQFEKFLTIIIPAYNESKRIKNTLLSIDNYIKEKNLDAEIIVVDDGSSDNTINIVQELTQQISNLRLISYPQNQGKGFAIKTGVNAAKGKYILFTDADNSTPIEEYENLMKKLLETNSQIAIGSRYLPESNIKIKQPFYRVFVGRAGNLLIKFFLIDNIQDTQCGFKLFEHEAAKNIFYFQKVKRFGFDMEALSIAKHFGYKIVEVPVTWTNSEDSRLRPIKDSIRTLKDLVYIKLNLLSGRYNQENPTIKP